MDEVIPPEAVDYRGAWQMLPVPGTWEETSRGSLGNYDGIAWYRALVKVPANWQGKEVQLLVEKVDNCHEAFVNGVRAGGAGAFPPNYQNGDQASNRYSLKNLK